MNLLTLVSEDTCFYCFDWTRLVSENTYTVVFPCILTIHIWGKWLVVLRKLTLVYEETMLDFISDKTCIFVFNESALLSDEIMLPSNWRSIVPLEIIRQFIVLHISAVSGWNFQNNIYPFKPKLIIRKKKYAVRIVHVNIIIVWQSLQNWHKLILQILTIT